MIALRDPERRLFDGLGIARLPAHHLALRIQPEEGISLIFRAKEPGPGMALDTVPMDFSYGSSFRPGRQRPTSGFCTTRWRAIKHSSCARTRSSGHGKSRLPFSTLPGPCIPYAAGTWGPTAADELIAPRAWQLG